MKLLKFLLLLVSGAFLLLSAVGEVLNVTQLFSINLPMPILFTISLVILICYLLLLIYELKWQLSRKREIQEKIDRLARFRQEAISSLYALTPTADEFPSWVDRFNIWEETLIKYMKMNFPYAVFEMFEDLGIVPGDQFIHTSKDPAISAQHLHHLRMLAKHIKILERLIEGNTTLLVDAKPSLGELLKWLPGQ